MGELKASRDGRRRRWRTGGSAQALLTVHATKAVAPEQRAASLSSSEELLAAMYAIDLRRRTRSLSREWLSGRRRAHVSPIMPPPRPRQSPIVSKFSSILACER